MAFQAMMSGGADCSTSANPLSQMLKHTEQDRSLQRDRMVPGAPGASLRHLPSTSSAAPLDARDRTLADQFFQAGPGPSASPSPFALESMRRELDGIGAGPAPRAGDWAGDFTRAGSPWTAAQTPGLTPQEREAMERSFQEAKLHEAHHVAQHQSAWRADFLQNQQHITPATAAGPHSAAFEQAFNRSFNWDQHFTMHNAKGKGKARLVELDDSKWEEQFAQFTSTAEPAAVSASATRIAAVDEDKALEAAFKDALKKEGLDVEKDPDYLAEFENVWNTLRQEGEASNPNLADWEREFSGEMARVREDMEDGLGRVGEDGFPRLGEYRFELNNPYLSHPDPLTEGHRLLRTGGALSEAALAFEAAAQREPSNAEAWLWLGNTRAMDEKEEAAIRALERCLREDEGKLEALISLAVSYTNEGYDTAATSTLERWITRKYPTLAKAPSAAPPSASLNPWASHERVTDIFLSVARAQSTGELDPDVQVGLGVLSYSTGNYDQARDCFAAALGARPEDWLLWNRLGATLANGGKPEEAIDAYRKALELRPTFTRAIYNLGVSCLNIGCYQEAAEHLLAAISLHQTGDGQAVNESQSLWQTLRRTFFAMDRQDLAALAVPGSSVEEFRKHGFDF